MPETRLIRRLAAIVAADVVDYSRLMETQRRVAGCPPQKESVETARL